MRTSNPSHNYSNIFVVSYGLSRIMDVLIVGETLVGFIVYVAHGIQSLVYLYSPFCTKYGMMLFTDGDSGVSLLANTSEKHVSVNYTPSNPSFI